MSCTDKDMGRTRDCNRTFLSAYLRFKLVEGGNPSVFLVRNSGLLQISSFPWSQSLCTTEGYTAYALRQNHLVWQLNFLFFFSLESSKLQSWLVKI